MGLSILRVSRGSDGQAVDVAICHLKWSGLGLDADAFCCRSPRWRLTISSHTEIEATQNTQSPELHLKLSTLALPFSARPYCWPMACTDPSRLSPRSSSKFFFRAPLPNSSPLFQSSPNQRITWCVALSEGHTELYAPMYRKKRKEKRNHSHTNVFCTNSHWGYVRNG